jgi:hypothetical protein
MQKLTKEQAIVISGYTGIMACKFGDFQEDVQKRMGRPVWTHEFGSEAGMNETIRGLYKVDFITMCFTDAC